MSMTDISIHNPADFDHKVDVYDSSAEEGGSFAVMEMRFFGGAGLDLSVNVFIDSKEMADHVAAHFRAMADKLNIVGKQL